MATAELLVAPAIGFIVGLALAALFYILWLAPVWRRRQRSDPSLPLLEAMETIASAPVERDALADAVALSAEKLFTFDGLQFGVFEASQFLSLKRLRRAQELELKRRPVGIEEQDIASWSLRHHAPHIFKHGSDPDISDAPALDDGPLFQSGEVLIIPIHGRERPQGMLSLESQAIGQYGEEDLEMAERIAAALSPVMARLRIQTEIEARSTQMVLLSEMSRRLISLQPMEDRLQHVAPIISQAFDFAQVRLYECVDRIAYLRATSHEDTNQSTEIPFGDGLVGRAALAKRTLELHEDNPSETPSDVETDGKIEGNQLAVPLMIEDRVLGVLQLSFQDARLFSPAQIAFAELLASILAIASLEAKNYAQQQEYTWINTVLLEVAKHAAQPGDPETSLRAVLQLTTLLAGARWAALLLPNESDDLLQLGPSSGLTRQSTAQLEQLTLQPTDFGVVPPYSEAETPALVDMPETVQDLVGDSAALVFPLNDGQRLEGLLLIGGPPSAGMRTALLTGIAHQISLRIENTRLIEQVAARRSLERELETARSIQESFLPDDMPDVADWDVGAIWVAARQVGGDFFDFIPLPGTDSASRWGVAIADVADKGVPAALFMALCRTLLRSVAPTHADPGDTLTRLNHLIFSETRPDLFVSLLYLIWEPDSGKITYANGGHNPPLLRFSDGSIRKIDAHDMVLGVDKDASYQSHTLTVPVGGLLLMYTDGVTEASDEVGNQFGLDKLVQLLQTSATGRDALGLTHLIANAIGDFSPDQEPFDDLTVVVLKHLEAKVSRD
jgi:serine phosphatase RsbU (regulator of sigma subunit)/putative methionine-R-sulfoxide reductase with GAF domain